MAMFRVCVHEQVSFERFKVFDADNQDEAQTLAAEDDWRTWEIDEDTRSDNTYIASVVAVSDRQ